MPHVLSITGVRCLLSVNQCYSMLSIRSVRYGPRVGRGTLFRAFLGYTFTSLAQGGTPIAKEK
jgi:hypothetical protein